MDIRSTGSACSPAERCDFMGTLAVPQAKRDPTVRSGSTAGDASDSDVSCHQADSRIRQEQERKQEEEKIRPEEQKKDEEERIRQEQQKKEEEERIRQEQEKLSFPFCIFLCFSFLSSRVLHIPPPRECRDSSTSPF